ncbi:MAG TPA: CoA pyrophosphatase [Vicinamibacteria bacterium]
MAVTWDDVDGALATRAPGRVDAPVDTRAAVAVVLREGPAGIEILFIRRAEDPRDPWSGQMAFPGGRQEPEDAELLHTAVRETKEEIGLDLGAEADYLGALDEMQAMARMLPLSLAIQPFVFRWRGAAPPEPGHEVRSVHWLSLDELLGGARRSTFEYRHEGAALEFPCLRVEDVVIWGLTYRMFLGFQERFAPREAVAQAGPR